MIAAHCRHSRSPSSRAYGDLPSLSRGFPAGLAASPHEAGNWVSVGPDPQRQPAIPRRVPSPSGGTRRNRFPGGSGYAGQPYRVPSPLAGEGQGEGSRAAARSNLVKVGGLTRCSKLRPRSPQRTHRRLPAPSPSPYPSPARGEGTLLSCLASGRRMEVCEFSALFGTTAAGRPPGSRCGRAIPARPAAAGKKYRRDRRQSRR
jgi:hypothetical protein